MLNGVDHINIVAYLANEGKPEAGKTKFDVALLDKNNQFLWKTKPGIDIGIVLLPKNTPFTIETSRITTLNSAQPSIGKFEYSQLATDSIIQSENIIPGNIIRALGYPNAYSYGEFENYPILMAGYLSTDIINDTINDPKYGGIKNTFMVNFFGGKGSSGSPVLSANEDRTLTQSNIYISIKIGSPTYVLGIIYSGPEVSDDPYAFLPVLKVSTTGRPIPYIPTEDSTARLIVPLLTPNIGLTYVIPAKYIREIIDLFP